MSDRQISIALLCGLVFAMYGFAMSYSGGC